MTTDPHHHESDAFITTAVEQHQGALLRYATRLLHGDADRARDVVQDTFVRLMAQPRAQVEDHLVEWLFTVCRHRALDFLRKDTRMTPLDPMAAERFSSPDPMPGPDIERRETSAAVMAMIDRLPPNQQEVIRLKFQNGFSYKEISRITSLSVGNVGFLIHTAVMRLRREMAGQPE
ncbi:MAG TPA: sigma-70 family RNA polymerase sigma factor [Candidatus Didemnitutus sp.]|nr:sigma-70 family RNA polymerase sigma factor [Candidatus Didemnitutus sp.]